jgi:phosphate transport system substrate-binding protein
LNKWLTEPKMESSGGLLIVNRTQEFVRVKFRRIATCFIACIVCAACASNDTQDPRGLTTLVSIDGSNTMTELLQTWAKAFMQKHPDIPVSVSSDDSGSGISALINKTTDVAAASRDLTDDEAKLATTKGRHLHKLTVAGDAIVILTNPSNPVGELSLLQLQDIFDGAKTNWKDFGGPSKPISVFSREKESGTHSYFLQHVLKGKPYAPAAKILRSSDAITKSVEKDPWSIAYEGLSFATNAGSHIRVLKVKLTNDGPGIAPTAATAIGAYPLSRPLILFVDEDAKPSVKKFVDFCASEEGQKLVLRAGYARLK